MDLIFNPEEDFDWSLQPCQLRELYKKTNFDQSFFKLIHKDVIKILSPQKIAEPHNLIYDEELVYEHLIAPLEKIICNLSMDATQEEVTQKFEHIQSMNQPSKVCRRILKNGDVTFSCNDCGLDGTCVVCIDCFHKSAHKDHNYRMSNSEGGCCDCGDIEAWKQHYACTDHLTPNQANLKLSDFEDKHLRSKQIHEDKKTILEKINLLPKSIATRYFLVCQASLHYARMLLSWNDYGSLPHWLEVDNEEVDDPELTHLLSSSSATKNFFTVLFNDEVHTYDHVINTLVKIIKCTKMTASVMASTVSREGRSLVINDNLKSCKQVKDMIAQVRDGGQLPLKVEIIHGTVLAHQAFALKLLEWLQRMSSICDAFRILTAYTLLGTFDPIPEREDPHLPELTLIEKVMLSNTSYWKIARVEWNDLFVTSMLTEYSIKEQFARLLTRIYPRLMEDFIHDDHEHSVSILTMTTQLYTVPSLICMLIEEENALAIITQTLISTCKSRKRENPTLSFENRHTFDMQGLKRGFYTIHDLKNLINIQPTKWTDQLRKNVIEAVKIFLELLSTMQGMDSVRRQLGQHLEYEPDWESGMTLQSRLITFITRLVAYCSFDEEVLVECLKETQTKLSQNGNFKLMTKKLLHHQVTCIHYDVSSSPVSVHLPLTRFAAALIVELMKRRPCERVPYDECLVMLVDNELEPGAGNGISNRYTPLSMIEILEPSLRTEVMIAQFRSGMWRRNGYSLVNQIMYFHGAGMRREMFDRDILVLQEGAAMCKADEFMIHLLNKFQLFNWVSSETSLESLVGNKLVNFPNDEEVMAQTMSLAEEFLQLLLTIISERYRVGVGIIEEDDVIKNEIIQMLCIGPSTRSELTQKLYVNDNELDCIKAVANLKRSTEASTGKYELKDEFYERFNPFFYHYSRRNQSNALDAQLKRKKNLKESLICCPPPVPIELTKQFSNLNELLKCDVTLTIIKKILTRALGSNESNQESSTKTPIRYLASDLQLDQCLHLIGIGLHEQERSPYSFHFIQAAQEHGIFKLLKDCHQTAERSKDLIFWLMKKTDHLANLLELKEVKELFKSTLTASCRTEFNSRERNLELAAQRRERIMAGMKTNQEKFRRLMEQTEKNESPQIDDGLNLIETKTCILCHEEQQIDLTQHTMVLLAYIQRSAVLSKNRRERRIPNYSLTPTNQLKNQLKLQADAYSFTSDNSLSFDATFMPSDLFFGPHISTCGHVMHYSCWVGFFDTIMRRETSRPNRNTRHVSFELEKHEFLCPLCECISNATIPLLPNYTNFSKKQLKTVFSAIPATIGSSSDNLSACLHVLKGTVDMFKLIRTIKDSASMNSSTLQNKAGEERYRRLMQPKKSINEVLEDLNETEALGLRDFFNSIRINKISSSSCTTSLLSSIRSLAERIYCVGLDLNRNCMTELSHDRIFMMTTWCISYTIQTLERSSRSKLAPIFEDLDSSKNLCLGFLLRFACGSMLTHHSDMMQNLLVRKLRYFLTAEDYLTSSPCCLDIDAFESFVSLFILLQKLYAHLDDLTSLSSAEEKPPSTSSSMNAGGQSSKVYAWTTQAFDHEYFRNLLHLMLIFNLVQVIISTHNEQQFPASNDGEKQPTDELSDGEQKTRSCQQEAQSNSKECIILQSLYNEIILASGHPNNRMPVIDETFSARIKDRLLPFLRSCALFLFHLSNATPPQTLCSKLTQDAAISQQSMDTGSSEDIYLKSRRDEFDSICQYLDLPDEFSVLLRSQEARHLAKAWSRHSRVLILIKSALKEKEEAANRAKLLAEYSLKPLKRAGSSSGALYSQHYTSTASSLPVASTSAANEQLQQQQISNTTELMPVRFISQPHSVNRLVELPYDYSELVDKVSDFSCPSIKNQDSNTPTMCLVCGVMLCSQSYCCQRDLNDLASSYKEILQSQMDGSDMLILTDTNSRAGGGTSSTSAAIQGSGGAHAFLGPSGVSTTQTAAQNVLALLASARGASAAASNSGVTAATLNISQQLVGSCTYHAYECSGGVGVFLRIRACQILLLSGRSKGCYMPAPYIDDHGETDFGLVRGNPLHLNRQHYEKLQQMWLSHTIPEQISRTLEYSPYASSINWHLH